MVGGLILAVLVWILDMFASWSLVVSLALWWGRAHVAFAPWRLLLLLLLGVLYDIAAVRPLGLTSGLLISLLLASWLIARHYQLGRLWWWYGLGLVGEIAMALIQETGVRLLAVGLQLVCLVLLQWWQGRFGRHDAIYIKT